jgi:hypothetical protein
MEKMFEQMQQGCFGNLQEKGPGMKGCLEKMAALCPCGGQEDLSEEDKTAMPGMMKSFCGSTPGMTSCADRCAGPSGR